MKNDLENEVNKTAVYRIFNVSSNNDIHEIRHYLGLYDVELLCDETVEIPEESSYIATCSFECTVCKIPFLFMIL